MSALLKLEVFKSRRRHVWDAMAILLIVQLLWGMWSANSYARHGYELLWAYELFQYPTLNCLLMPFVVAVLASRLSDIEHKSGSFRLLSTLAAPAKLYAAKFLWGALLLMIAAVGQTVMLVTTSKLVGFTGAPPYTHLALMALSTFLCSMCLLALQQALSLLVKNQVIAMMAGLGGGFIGLFALYFRGGLANLSIWSLFARLSTVFANWELSDRSMMLHYSQYNWLLALGVVGLTALIYGAGRWLFARKEW